MKKGKFFLRLILIIFLLFEFFLGLWFLKQKNLIKNRREKIEKAESDLLVLKDAVIKFREKYGRPPLTLKHLIQGDNPILKELPRDPFPGPDPSNETYYYAFSQDGHFVIYSCGPNSQNDCDIDNYLEATRVSRSLGSGEEPKDCDDIIVSDLPIKDR